MLVSNQTGEVNAVVVATHFYLLLPSFDLALRASFGRLPIEIVWPTAGCALKRVSMIAEGCVNGGIEGDTPVETSRGQRQETALTRASHTQFLSVPRRKLLDIVNRTFLVFDDVKAAFEARAEELRKEVAEWKKAKAAWDKENAEKSATRSEEHTSELQSLY